MAAATAENGASSPPPTTPQSSAEALNTEHLYYEDTELYTNTGHVTGQWDTEMNGEKRKCIVLDRTVMHPQGGVCVCVVDTANTLYSAHTNHIQTHAYYLLNAGGQPADSGTISSPDGNVKFEVIE